MFFAIIFSRCRKDYLGKKSLKMNRKFDSEWQQIYNRIVRKGGDI